MGDNYSNKEAAELIGLLPNVTLPYLVLDIIQI